MTKKVLSRRDFLRFAGLVGAAASIPAIEGPENEHKDHASDEVWLDPAGHGVRPWWVKTVDEPTTIVDWENIKRFDARYNVLGNLNNLTRYFSNEEIQSLNLAYEENEKKRILAGTPGYRIEDYALYAAQSANTRGERRIAGLKRTPTPEERGVPKWTGSEDDAARIIRVAMRQFGAADIGFLELNEKTRKLIYSFDRDGKEVCFEDVDEAYETQTKRVIPNSARWVIVYAVQMSGESIKRAPTVISESTSSWAYAQGRLIQNQTQDFLRGLGYQCVGQATSNGIGITPAFAVLAGLGELSRSNRVISPKFGPMMRLFMLITDLPVTVDKPIDAGIAKFCRVCKKCAETCPAGALSLDDEPAWLTKGEWNNPGHQAYYEDAKKCYAYWKSEAGSGCGICFAVCPFSKKDKVWLHQWIKASISEAPVFNRIIRTMDDAFSYGARKNPDDWWYLNLPEYGIDTEMSK